MHQNTDWEKDFDELWEHYNLSRAEVDREIVSDFIRSLLQTREKWLLKQVKELPWNGQVVNPEWRDEVLTILTPEKK